MYEPWSQLHANLMFHAARYCLHRFAKVELSRRSRKASHRAAFTTFKKEKKDHGESVVEGEDCPELVIVAESTLFLLFADGYVPSLSGDFKEGTSAVWLHEILKPCWPSGSLSDASRTSTHSGDMGSVRTSL